MASTLTKNRKTPGVYVTEFTAFPPSVVGVETALPIFVGYTEFATDPASGKQMYMQAVAISSMADYYNYFGHGYDSEWMVEVVTTPPPPPPPAPPPPPPPPYDFQAPSSSGSATAPTLESFLVAPAPTTSQFNLYTAMQLFYANGGGNCFVVSVANYEGKTFDVKPETPAANVEKQPLLDGLAVAAEVRGPTMLVVPDACLLVTPPAGSVTTYTYPDYGSVVRAMLDQSLKLQDRVAILDMPGALIPTNWTIPAMKDERDAFYTAISASAPAFSYGAAYGPAVESSLLSAADVLYTSLKGDTDTASINLMNNLLTTQALTAYPPYVPDPKNAPTQLEYTKDFQDIAAHIAAAFPPTDATASTTIEPSGTTGTTTAPALEVSMPNLTKAPVPTNADQIKALDQYLVNSTPLLGQIQQILASKLNVAPPSGIMAGVWTRNDLMRGVWNAPANVTLSEVIAPMVTLNQEEQGNYNMPTNGNAIDILRPMINRGTVVWGARTLDGNSLDYRYIQVRRTLVYIEQSIKLALQQFVFAANDGGTWAVVTATISNFLTQLWQAGGLMGDKASEAFTVKCGVPTTMSGLDVLNGYMIVNVTVQMIHPAEFIELTFTQTMQGV